MNATPQEVQEKSFFKAIGTNVLAGWKALYSEFKWIFIKGFRRWEIRQLQKRLNTEYQDAGKIFVDRAEEKKSLDPQLPEAEMCIKQISFLKDEIEHMENELTTSRKEYVARQNQK